MTIQHTSMLDELTAVVPYEILRTFRMEGEGGQGGAPGAPAGEGPGTNGAGNGQSFAQADVDRIVEQRLARERAKFADYDDLKQTAAKWKDHEAKSQTEQEKLEARAKQAEDQIPTLQLENARLKTALAKGLPSDLAARLQGGTQEELDADADKLLELVGQRPSANRSVGAPDLRQGQRGNVRGDQVDGNDWIRSLARGSR